MNKDFKTIYKPTTNMYSGNFSAEPKIFILHGTMGELKSALPWLQGKNGNKGSSAHFCIDRDGTVYNLADVKKRTWHSGVVKQPNEKAREILAKYGDNPNKYSIGIEVVIKWGEEYSDAQVQAVCDLYEYLADKYEYAIALDDNRLVCHKDFHVDKPNLDASRERIIKELKKRGIWSEVIADDNLSYIDRVDGLFDKLKGNEDLWAKVKEWAVRIITWYIKNRKA